MVVQLNCVVRSGTVLVFCASVRSTQFSWLVRKLILASCSRCFLTPSLMYVLSTSSMAAQNAFQSVCDSPTLSLSISGSLSRTCTTFAVPESILARFASSRTFFACTLYASTSTRPYNSVLSRSSAFNTNSSISLSNSAAIFFTFWIPGNLLRNSVSKVAHVLMILPMLAYQSSAGESGVMYSPKRSILSRSAVTCVSCMIRKNRMMNVGPWILPSGLPSNSSRVVSGMMGELGSGTGVWLGDGGGAGGKAGDRVGDWSDSVDVVSELSDSRLEDKEVV